MTRKWLPSEWMDEMPPRMGTSPDDFLKRNAAGVLQLTPIEKDLDPEDWPQPADIEQGAEIAFCWVEHHGSAMLVVNADGTWRCDEDFPEGTNWYFYDLEHLADSIGELVAGDEGITDPLEPGEYLIEGATWSQDNVVFEVKVLETGAATFVEVRE